MSSGASIHENATCLFQFYCLRARDLGRHRDKRQKRHKTKETWRSMLPEIRTILFCLVFGPSSFASGRNPVLRNTAHGSDRSWLPNQWVGVFCPEPEDPSPRTIGTLALSIFVPFRPLYGSCTGPGATARRKTLKNRCSCKVCRAGTGTVRATATDVVFSACVVDRGHFLPLPF